VSVVPMKLVTLTGPQERFEAAMHVCVMEQEFHPEPALPYLSGVDGITPITPENPYLPLLRKGELLAAQMNIPLEFRSFDDYPDSLEIPAAYLQSLEEKRSEWNRQRDELERNASELRAAAASLEPLLGFPGDLDELRSMHYVQFRYGHLPIESFERYQPDILRLDQAFFFETARREHRVYGVYVSAEQDTAQADALFHSLRFHSIALDERAHGDAAHAVSALSAEAGAAETSAAGYARKLFALTEQETEQLLTVICYLRFHSELCELRKFAVRSQGSFYLMGWVPTQELTALDRRIGSVSGFRLSYVADDPEYLEHAVPPTKLSNHFFARMFQPLLSMYGLPSYHELDPSLFMAITYCIFYGIMFGDVGQGLCLSLLGILLARRQKFWLGNIIACCGLSGAFFGCVYGSVFGFEDILPGFKILEGSHVLILLIFSIALGVFMLGLSMLFNIVNGIRQKNWEKILFGANGVAGFLFYLGIVFAVVSPLTVGFNAFQPAYVFPVLVLPLLLMLFREPLSLLMRRDPGWKTVSLSELLTIGFFELFEILLSFLTNTLSFLRVGAYAITHVSLMLVVQMLAGSHLNPVVIVLGNAFVLGFEGFLVGIQVLRLEFYELFGRFYSDGGLEYRPKRIQYSEKSK